MDRTLTILALMIGIPVVFSALMVWIGWRRGCTKEERLRREQER